VDFGSYWITPRNGLGWGTDTMGEAGVGMGDARPAAAALAPKGVGEKTTSLHLRVSWRSRSVLPPTVRLLEIEWGKHALNLYGDFTFTSRNHWLVRVPQKSVNIKVIGISFLEPLIHTNNAKKSNHA